MATKFSSEMRTENAREDFFGTRSPCIRSDVRLILDKLDEAWSALLSITCGGSEFFKANGSEVDVPACIAYNRKIRERGHLLLQTIFRKEWSNDAICAWADEQAKTVSIMEAHAEQHDGGYTRTEEDELALVVQKFFAEREAKKRATKQTPSDYAGWTCGKCSKPVAGRFSKCEACGHGGLKE